MNGLAIAAGALMLLAVFGGGSAVVARDMGWGDVLLGWAFSLAATAVITCGVCLVVWGFGAW